MKRGDLISRGDLFNELATVQAADANEMKGKIYSIIQAMPAAGEKEKKPDPDCAWK